LTIAPAPLARKCSSVALTVRKAPARITSNTPCRSGSLLAKSAFSGPHGHIIDEDVEAAETCDGPGNQAFDGGASATSARIGSACPPMAAMGPAIAPAVDDHGSTRGGQRQANGPVDVAAGAGDEGNAAPESVGKGHGTGGLKIFAAMLGREGPSACVPSAGEPALGCG
jgi:hypothetical protein